MVLDLVEPASVIDIGCGIGNWLAVFREQGIEDLLGIDGDYVEEDQLLIPPDWFLAFDLTRPIHLERRFDLVVSLEVAEHLPAERSADFIRSLVKLGPVVLFSAAIPFQGGTHHVNEQWPEYWAELFQKHDYAAIDCIRPRIWTDDRVEWWYAQNVLLFAEKKHLADHPKLKAEVAQTRSQQLSVVHPRYWLAANYRLDILRQLPVISQDLSRIIPDRTTFVLVDQGGLDENPLPKCHRFHFPERNGQYWGLPADDATAISELERMRASGARFIVFIDQTFWWLDYYAGFGRHLRENFRVALENDNLLVFDLSR